MICSMATVWDLFIDYDLFYYLSESDNKYFTKPNHTTVVLLPPIPMYTYRI